MKRSLFLIALFAVPACTLEPMRIPSDAGILDAGTGGSGGHPEGCSDSNPCPEIPDSCHVATCQFNGTCTYEVPAPAGNPCNGKGVCDGHGVCGAAGPACKMDADCDDGDQCTGDVCYAASHTCGHYDMPNCTPLGCHTSVDCDDSNPCTNDVCYTFAGECFNDPLPDNTPCPLGVCSNGKCIGIN